MTDYTNALAGPPIMPETYDRQNEAAGLPYLRAFGAGLVDPLPFGLTEYMANRLSQSGHLPPNADLQARRLREMQNEAPFTAGTSAALIPSGVGLGVLRAIGQLTTREALDPKTWLALTQMGGGLSDLSAAIRDAPAQKRPQAAYPPGGAY